MIYCILSKTSSHHRDKILDFLKENIRNRNYKYEFIFTDKHLLDKQIEKIKNNDIILWQPIVAYDNLALVKFYKNSIVILSKPTVYLQKISKYNPINENMAINHGFFICYISPKKQDITNDDWKLVAKDSMFSISKESLWDLIEQNPNAKNNKDSKIKIEKTFNEIIEFTNNQINLK